MNATFLTHSLVLLTFGLGGPGFAEQHSTGSALDGAAKRRTGKQFEISDRESRLLARVTGLPDSFIKKAYGNTLPQAITDAQNKKDESAIIPILVDLMGVLNEQQVGPALKLVEKEREAEKKDNDNERDGRFLTLTDRLFWALKWMDGDSVKTEAADKYTKQFKQSFEDDLPRKLEFQEKLKLAEQGVKNGIEYVKEFANSESVLPFLMNNEELRGRMLKILASSNAQGPFVDLFDGNERQRLYGKKIDQALETYAQKRGGLHGVRFANQNHKQLDRIFTASDDGGLQNRVVQNTQPPTTPKDNRRPAQNPQNDGKTTSGEPSFSEVKALLLSSCTGCHVEIKDSFKGTSVRDISFKIKTGRRNLKDLVATMNARADMGAALEGMGVADTFRAWAKIK